MRFTVTWLPAADARLAALWMQAPDQREFTEAADRIDRALMSMTRSPSYFMSIRMIGW